MLKMSRKKEIVGHLILEVNSSEE